MSIVKPRMEHCSVRGHYLCWQPWQVLYASGQIYGGHFIIRKNFVYAYITSNYPCAIHVRIGFVTVKAALGNEAKLFVPRCFALFVRDSLPVDFI